MTAFVVVRIWKVDISAQIGTKPSVAARPVVDTNGVIKEDHGKEDAVDGFVYHHRSR